MFEYRQRDGIAHGRNMTLTRRCSRIFHQIRLHATVGKHHLRVRARLIEKNSHVNLISRNTARKFAKFFLSDPRGCFISRSRSHLPVTYPSSRQAPLTVSTISCAARVLSIAKQALDSLGGVCFLHLSHWWCLVKLTVTCCTAWYCVIRHMSETLHLNGKLRTETVCGGVMKQLKRELW